VVRVKKRRNIAIFRAFFAKKRGKRSAKRGLFSTGTAIYTAENGRRALELFEKNNIALVLLDLMLPDISGGEICAAIRKKSRVPILMLTAKAEEASHLNGLAISADDYITKPFSLKVLAAHVEAILRRTEDDLIPLTVKSSWRGGDLVVDFAKNTVLKKGTELTLTPSERKILSALIKYPGKVFSREELIALIFDDDFDSFDRVIDNHIKNLRQKIEDDTKRPVYVLTIRGLGYKFGGDPHAP
jgi:DNA-binding response OmpR family regulator